MSQLLKKILGEMASMQSSTKPFIQESIQEPTQPPIDDISSKEYSYLFNEAHNYHMPPYDFRVWDRYLFSRCTSRTQILGLWRLYEWPLRLSRGRVGIDDIGKWCMDGKFTYRVKKLINNERMTCNPDYKRINRDLSFIQENQEILDLGPMNISRPDDAHKELWLKQAKGCIMSRKIPKSEREWLFQEGYFALGVIVWGIMPEPNWVLEDIRFDLWYHLGYGATHFLGAEQLLLSRYQKVLSKAFGISSVTFSRFVVMWNTKITLMYYTLSKDWECPRNILSNLEYFFVTRKPGATSYGDDPEESVCRLYHLMSLSDQDYHRLVKKDMEKFRQAEGFFCLIRDFENEETDPIARKNIYIQIMKHIKCPGDLHRAFERDELREFAQKVYDQLEMNISERELDLIYFELRW
ncbi:hypothetical protein EYB25_008333 [Talaromyces marneffei]|nr:hypothetical protein EYB25_008333 [Talaromyces marneffei]